MATRNSTDVPSRARRAILKLLPWVGAAAVTPAIAAPLAAPEPAYRLNLVTSYEDGRPSLLTFLDSSMTEFTVSTATFDQFEEHAHIVAGLSPEDAVRVGYVIAMQARKPALRLLGVECGAVDRERVVFERPNGDLEYRPLLGIDHRSEFPLLLDSLSPRDAAYLQRQAIGARHVADMQAALRAEGLIA